MPTTRTHHAERGITVALLALMILPILGAIGLAIDVGRLYSERQCTQAAAEAAIVAGALEGGRFPPNTTAFATAANTYASNFPCAGTIAYQQMSFPRTGQPNEDGWELTLTHQVQTKLIGPLLTLSTNGVVPVVGKARVRMRRVPKGIHILHPTAVNALLTDRNTIITVNSSVYVNSQSATAVHVDQNSGLKTSYPIRIRGTGNYSVTTSGSGLSPTPIRNVPAEPDPLANLPMPNPCDFPVRMGTTASDRELFFDDGNPTWAPGNNPLYSPDAMNEIIPVPPLPPGDTRVFLKAWALCPGVYNGGIKVKNTYVKFCTYGEPLPCNCPPMAMDASRDPGCQAPSAENLFIIRGGGLKIWNAGHIEASGGLTIAHMKHPANKGNEDIRPGGTITLNPSTSGPWEGVAFLVDRDASMTNDVDLAASALEHMVGDIYVPWARVKVGGQQKAPGYGVVNASLIVYSLRFGGYVDGDNGDPVLVAAPTIGFSGREIVLAD